MRKHLTLAITAAMLAIATPACASEFASVTISLSVYLAPAIAEPLSVTSANQEIGCDTALSNNIEPISTTCQDGYAAYSWAKSHDDGLVLTIAPI